MIPFRMALICLALVSAPLTAADLDLPPISYSRSPADNSVSRLIDQVNAGKVELKKDKAHGYLRSMLAALNVSESSQVLVFSKTSLQRDRITPQTPRAIYFNDDVYVGYCRRGRVMELSAVDPNLGTVFYTLDQVSAVPKFSRQGDSCLICHASSHNQGLPGHLVRSVFPDTEGLPLLASGSYRIDQSSPLKQRWGGWYVSGTSGKQAHLGNLILQERQEPEEIDNKAGQNVTDLSPFFETSQYLTPHSDIVALMVLEHQAQMHNLISRAGILSRVALHEEAELNKALNRGAGYRSESTISRIKNACEPLVHYMLYKDEAQITEPIRGTTTFARDFARPGVRDSKGRSLRELDLNCRMFKYPCSYLVYSSAFDAIPTQASDYIWQRLDDILSGQGKPEFGHLSAGDRLAVREILLETRPKQTAKWRR